MKLSKFNLKLEGNPIIKTKTSVFIKKIYSLCIPENKQKRKKLLKEKAKVRIKNYTLAFSLSGKIII